MVTKAPGALNLVMLDAALKGQSRQKYHSTITRIVQNLVGVVFKGIDGDERADDQIEAIEKLAHPEKYDLPKSRIKELLRRFHTPPSLARGWELRELMDKLWLVVESVSGRADSSGPVRLRSYPDPSWGVFELAGKELFELAQKHLRPGSTLQSLAIRCYLEQLKEQELITAADEKSQKSLERDLRILRQWEKAHPDPRTRFGPFSQQIALREYSEGWKVKRRKTFPRGKQPKGTRGGKK